MVAKKDASDQDDDMYVEKGVEFDRVVDFMEPRRTKPIVKRVGVDPANWSRAKQ